MVIVALMAGAAIASPRHRSDPVTAVDARTGHKLPANPALHTGQRVVVTATGFAPRARVTVGLVGVRLLAEVSATDAGNAVYTYTVAVSLATGGHELIFSGPGGSVSSGTSAPRGNFRVTVPLDETWPFRVVGPPTAYPSGSHGAGGEHGGQGSTHHRTSGTGVDVLILVAAGLLAVLAGAAALGGGRRRRRHTG
jgi:hypothetical protein